MADNESITVDKELNVRFKEPELETNTDRDVEPPSEGTLSPLTEKETSKDEFTKDESKQTDGDLIPYLEDGKVDAGFVDVNEVELINKDSEEQDKSVRQGDHESGTQKPEMTKYIPIKSEAVKVDNKTKDMKLQNFTRAFLLPGQSFSYTSRASKYIQKNIKMKHKEDIDGEITEVPTTCFGDVEFRGAARRSRAKFIRLSSDTPPSVVYKLMITHWKMEKPRLLISVTGGAKNFNIDPKLQQNFAVGLSKVASTPGCWVISGGTNAGVMKHVGEALQGSSKACIGIATWGVISNREAINPATGRRVVRQISYKKKLTSHRKVYSYEVGSWLTEKGAFLDSNHTHFLLVDDGSENKFGVEIPFRGQFEKYIMAKTLEKGKSSRSVPSVLLVVQGGPGTLGTVHSAVAGEDPVPVVIVKSSGRAADLLVYALTLRKDILEKNTSGGEHEGLASCIKSTFPELDTDIKRKGAYDKVIDCLNFGEMFTISQVGTDVDIDDAILTALLNDRSTDKYRQLQLTLIWNRPDLARSKIFSQMLEWKDDPMQLQWITLMALAMDNVEFVRLLLEYGVSISSFLTNEVLEFLYGYRSYSKSSPMRYEFGEKHYKPIPANCENQKVYKALCAQDDLLSVSRVMIPRRLIEDQLSRICRIFKKFGNERFIEDVSEQITKDENDITFQYPFRELFFWAVLNNMKDMAIFFWNHGEEHMAKGLIGVRICEKIAYRINQDDMEETLLDIASTLREGTLEILDQSYRIDERNTRRLITYNLNQFKGLSVLNLAVDSENLDFVSHHSVQALLENVWIGNLKLKKVSYIRLFIAYITFFPLIFNMFEFRTKEEIAEIKAKLMSYDDYEGNKDDSEDSDNEKEERMSTLDRFKTIKERKSRIERGQGTQLPWYEKIVEFYWRTPVVTFMCHSVGYVLFLIVFAYVSMLQKTTALPGVWEWIVIVTVFAFFVAEMYQIVQYDAPTVWDRFKAHASSQMNRFDLFVILFYFVALGLRLDVSSVRTRRVGHVLYALDCGFWIFRLLHVFSISPTLGPYLVMIKRMTKDLFTFLNVLIVIIIGYGVIAAAILKPYPKQDIRMLSNIFWHPYFNIYGELFVEREPESNSTNRFGTEIRDYYDETLMWIFLGIYLLFTNILLLNLLIAVFNNTYMEVQAKASQIWAFKRYQIILEYSQRHALFAPLSILGFIVLLIRWLYRKVTGYNNELDHLHISGLRSRLTDEQIEDLVEFECMCMTKMCKSKTTGVSKSLEETTSEILDEIDDMKSDMVIIKDKLQKYTTIGETKTKDEECSS